MIGRFVDEALEPAGLPELAGAGIGGIDRKLRRQQHGIDAGIRNLLRHQLAVAHVALQRRAVAVEEHDDDAGLADVEILRDMHQHAVVVVGLVLPVDPAAIAAVAAAVALGDVQERLVGARIVAEIGEGRGFQADQRGLIFSAADAGRAPSAPAMRPGRARAAACAVRRRGGVGGLALREALARGREAIPELRCREAVVEGIAGRGLRHWRRACRRSAPVPH